MNPYFWAFVLYAVMIAPVRVRVQLAVDHGLRVYQKIQNSEEGKNKRKKRKMLFQAVVSRRGLPGKILRMFAWREAEIGVNLSFQDAAATALSFAAVRQVLYAAECCARFPLETNVSADFQARGSSLRFRCIADTRVGNLSAAAVRLWLASAAGRAQYPDAEEDNDATSH